MAREPPFLHPKHRSQKVSQGNQNFPASI